MTEQSPALTRHDLEAKIVKRCWEDEEFRKDFTSDPAGVFAKYLNVPADDLPQVVVYQETAGSWHIVLPAKPANADELSEQDLEKVSGGTTPSLVAISIVTAGSAISLSVSGAITTDQGW
jgi:hypothetical protein